MSDEIDRLMDEQRIRGRKREIAEGSAPEDVTREQAEAVIQNVIDFMAASNGAVTRAGVARDLGIAPTTLGSVLNRRYPASASGIVIELDRWLEMAEKRAAAPKVDNFVWTRVAREMQAAAGAAATLPTIALVYSGRSSGVGKTMALAAIAEETPGAILVTIEKMNATSAGLLRSIWRAMGGGERGIHGRTLYEAIKGKLRGSSRLLLIDQIHNLCSKSEDDKAFYVLCDLFDATGAGQLWCGTSDLLGYFHRGIARGREPLTQISSRIGIQLDLLDRVDGGGTGGGGAGGSLGEPLYGVEEIRKIFASNKMRLTPEAIRSLLLIANAPENGALRTALNVARLARAINAGADALTDAMIAAAHRMTLSRARYAAQADRMEAIVPLAAARAG
jgi:DNA transposition AAA+ family ATPase